MCSKNGPYKRSVKKQIHLSDVSQEVFLGTFASFLTDLGAAAFASTCSANKTLTDGAVVCKHRTKSSVKIFTTENIDTSVRMATKR